MGGGGSPYNAQYVEATRIQAWSNLAISKEESDADRYTALQQSQAVVTQAKEDARARIYEADQNRVTQMEALRVRLQEAKWEREVGIREINVEAARVDVLAQKADTERGEADTERMEAEADIDLDRQRYESRNNTRGSYWNG